MIMTLILMFITMTIPIIMMIFNLVLSKNKKLNFEKSTPFECGFDPMSSNRLPFSVQFFMIGLIFLIFDVEITLLIPLIQMLNMFSIQSISLCLMFMLLLILGLYLEYMENSLDWKF